MFISPTFNTSHRLKDGLRYYLDFTDLNSYNGVNSTTDGNSIGLDDAGYSLINTPTLVTTPNIGYSFDGINNYVNCDYVADINEELADSTIDFWVYPQPIDRSQRYNWAMTRNALYGVVGVAYNPLAASSGTPGCWSCLCGSVGSNRFRLNTGEGFPEELQHVTLTKRAGGDSITQYNMKFYINGVLVPCTLDLDTATTAWWFDNMPSNLTRFRLATLYRSTQNYAGCDIHEMAVYDRELNASEVLTNYEATRNKYGI